MSRGSLIDRRLRALYPGVLHDKGAGPTGRAAGNRTAPSTGGERFQVAVLSREDDTTLAVITCQEDAGTISIGRSVNAQIRIEDPHISRFHAELRWDAAIGVHLLSDLQSANGTYINGRRIQGDVYLRAGSRLRFGMTQLKYQCEQRPA